MMASRKVNYSEGDWFAVPLLDGDHGLGVIARVGARGVLLGYFFGPRFHEIPKLQEVPPLKPRQAALVALFGDLHLIEGTWQILGRREGWRRERWPAPPFGRVNEVDNAAWKVWYSEEDLTTILEEEECEIEEAAELPPDSLLGAGAVEIVLTRCLAK
jgi:hypothetical protein